MTPLPLRGRLVADYSLTCATTAAFFFFPRLELPDRGFCAKLQAPPPIVIVPQAFVLSTVWCCVDWWNVRWSEHRVVLCWLVECTVTWAPCGTVLTSGMHGNLSTVWYCVDWWNARWPEHHVVLCWLVECTVTWAPCGTVLTGGMHGNLSTVWYCVDRWNARWPEHRVVLCWLVECRIIWVWFHHSNDCNPPHLVVTDISLVFSETCTVTYFACFVWNPPVFHHVAML